MANTDNRVQVMFPDSYIDLSRELQHHPDLCSILDQYPSNEFEIRLAQIAAYCEVILDGSYVPSDLERVAKILHGRLVARRTGIVISSGKVQ